MTAQRAYNARCRAAKASRGECAWCPAPAVPGKTLCETCAGKNRLRMSQGPSRDRILRKKYGVTAEWYERQLAAQGGHCAICPVTEPGGRSKFFHVDHDHETGKVRGLLCHACNLGLGAFRDSVKLLAGAIVYLKSI